MNSLLIAVTSLLLGGLVGWRLRQRTISRTAAVSTKDPLETTGLNHDEPMSAGLQSVFDGIRADLADHFETLNGLVEQLGAVDKTAEESTSVLDETEQLVEKLALVYDDMRRFGDRLPVSHDSRTDPVTLVGNERALEDWLQMHFAYLSRYGNEFSISLFALKFGEENATNVEPQRLNVAVKHFAELLTDSARGTDKVFRYSANEFVVALPETPLEGALVFADRVARNSPTNVQQTVSGGVAEARHTDSMRTLLSRADSALFQAKSQDQHRVCFHDGSQIGSAADRPFVPAEV